MNLLRRIVITANDGDLQMLGDDDTKKCLAWLEKQKEQKMKGSMGIVRARITRDKMGQVIFELPDNSDSYEFILLRDTKNLPNPKCGSSVNVGLIIIKGD